MTLVLAALLVASTSAFVARRPRALAAAGALASSAFALGVAVWQRRAWEFEVRRVAWVADAVLPRLTVTRRFGSLAIHPTCSSVRMGLDAALLAVAGAIAERVVVPDGWGCCGFAGDRGMLHPELTAAATAAEARSVRDGDVGQPAVRAGPVPGDRATVPAPARAGGRRDGVTGRSAPRR